MPSVHERRIQLREGDPKRPGTFLSDQHPDLRADFVMANPPFNISEWWDGKLDSTINSS